ncbi:MAG: alkaline phytoceramidase, partial [Alphaproteobacteria bacterium]
GAARFAGPLDRLPGLGFFAGTMLVAAGSAWYHLAPANGSLVWDRLAMSLAFMALFAGFVADRIDARTGVLVALPAMTALGVASVLWWHASESVGAGDLRFYFLLNPLWPAAILLLLCAVRPGNVTRGPWVLAIGGFYALAILCEQADLALFDLTGALVSGHTLKHLVSSGAVFAVLWMLWRAPRHTVTATRP